MIGSGIFRVPAAAAAQTGSAGAMLLAWVVGGIVALCGALALAEVAALFPQRRRDVRLPARGVRPAHRRFCSDGCISSSFPPVPGAIALVFAEYLGRLVPLTPGQVRGVATRLIVLLAAAQYRSVRFGAAIQNAPPRQGRRDPLADRRRVPARRAGRRRVGRRRARQPATLERLRARRGNGALGVQRLAGRDLSLG